jgi:hypothetical protein
MATHQHTVTRCVFSLKKTKSGRKENKKSFIRVMLYTSNLVFSFRLVASVCKKSIEYHCRTQDYRIWTIETDILTDIAQVLRQSSRYFSLAENVLGWLYLSIRNLHWKTYLTVCWKQPDYVLYLRSKRIFECDYTNYSKSHRQKKLMSHSFSSFFFVEKWMTLIQSNRMNSEI